MKELKNTVSKPFVAAFSFLLLGCQMGAEDNCGETFCLTGDQVEYFEKNQPTADFDFYQAKFKGVDIGIYEGDHATLPDEKKPLSVEHDKLWLQGCLEDVCSIWLAKELAVSPKMVVLSVPKKHREVLSNVLPNVEIRN